MTKATKRIRVYGQAKSDMDPDLLVPVLILLGREMHAKQVASASPASDAPAGEAEAAS